MLRGLLLFLMPVIAAAQVICALGAGTSKYQPSEDQRPAADAMQLANRMNGAINTICGSSCPQVALFRNPTAPNAALIRNAGNPKLVYAPQFLAAVYASSGDPGIMAIMAHELGHALDDTMGARWISSKWTPELRADSWAGCILARSNLNSNDLQAALATLQKYPSPAQPGWNLRLPPIRSGFTNCGGEASKFDSGRQPRKPR